MQCGHSRIQESKPHDPDGFQPQTSIAKTSRTPLGRPGDPFGDRGIAAVGAPPTIG
jgi:hypothetical protein